MKITKQKIKKIIKEEIKAMVDEGGLAGHYEGAGPVEEIDRDTWRMSRPEPRDDVYDPSTDVPLIQKALGPEYYVVDALDRGQMNSFVSRSGSKGPKGEEVVVPLNTMSTSTGQRVNFFKLAHHRKYFKLVS